MRRIALIFLRYIVYFLDHLIRKDKNLVIFSQARSRYSDNPRALFEYLHSSSSNFNGVWLTNSKIQEGEILNKFPKGLHENKYSFRGIFLFLKAGFIVISHGSGDIAPFNKFSKKKKVIFLWHGIAIKNFGVLDHSANEKAIKNHLNKEASFVSFMTSSSKLDRLVNSSCYGIPANQVWISGLPRNDVFFKKQGRNLLSTSLHEKLSGKTLVLYAPTFRDHGGKTSFFPFTDFCVDNLEHFLNENNLSLLLRPHPNDSENLEFCQKLDKESDGCIIALTNQQLLDVADILPFIDIIITDYSSIYIDGLLKDIKPIFIPYDLTNYEKERGLLYDYELITPGPKVVNMEEFISALEDARNGAWDYEKQRRFVQNIFHEFNDGKACERIVENMKSLI